MRPALKVIDAILRGRISPKDALGSGAGISVRNLLAAGAMFGAIYGAFMGLYGTMRPDNADIRQMVASIVKMPLLFIATLLVTYPSLYVFSAIAGVRAGFLDLLKLLLLAATIMSVMLASFGPITGFFTLSTTSYGFMILLNVLFVAIAGLVGLGILKKMIATLLNDDDLILDHGPSVAAVVPPTSRAGSDQTKDDGATVVPPNPSPAPRPRRDAASIVEVRRRATGVFRVWFVLYAVVGAQMSWILRPLIGNPEEPFRWFRPRDSNFLEAVLGVLANMLR